MRKLTVLFAIACMLTMIGVLTAQEGAEKAAVQSAEPVRIAKTYSVKDLPVWSENGTKFDPSILVALLKSKVTPGQWNGKNSINSFAEKALLVVNTTQEAHEAIAANLAELRRE
jgi:hypothetical protein